jgi:hypothetical protein
MLRSCFAGIVGLACVGLFGCRDLTHFSTGDGHYEGTIVAGDFVRAGIGDATRLCVTLDADNLQQAPGTLSSSDGKFSTTPMRPIPQIWHDSLSTLTFGEGRVKNLVYMAAPSVDAGDSSDVTVIVSLLQSDAIEVRLLRGAPLTSADGGAATSSNLFGVFTLVRAPGACPF